MDTQNSQKRSPRSSAKSKRETSERPEASRSDRSPFYDPDDEEKYLDRTFDLVVGVRAAQKAAQREMESFGDASEYEVTIIQGQLKEEPNAAAQASLEFESDVPHNRKEEA